MGNSVGLNSLRRRGLDDGYRQTTYEICDMVWLEGRETEGQEKVLETKHSGRAVSFSEPRRRPKTS